MPTALRRSKSLPALLAVFAALVVIATIAAVLISNVMPTHRSLSAGDAADDMSGSVGRASRVAAVGPLSGNNALRGDGASDRGVSGGVGVSAAPDSTASDIAASGPAAASLAATEPASAASDKKDSEAAAAHSPHMRTAAHRATAPSDMMRTGGTLRADIARYNAERRVGGHAAILRAASVPSVHSLWDEVPGPMSDVYRN